VSTIIANLPQKRGFPGLAMSVCEIDGWTICLPSQNKMAQAMRLRHFFHSDLRIG
jgi:hypothetical protein